jgi:hypothetical protein
MRLPALVLVHGAVHAGDCWDLTIGEIHRWLRNSPCLPSICRADEASQVTCQR